MPASRVISDPRSHSYLRMAMNRSFVVLPLSNPPFYNVRSFNSWSVCQASSTFGRRFDPESSAIIGLLDLSPSQADKTIWLLTPFVQTFGRRMMIGQASWSLFTSANMTAPDPTTVTPARKQIHLQKSQGFVTERLSWLVEEESAIRVTWHNEDISKANPSQQSLVSHTGND